MKVVLWRGFHTTTTRKANHKMIKKVLFVLMLAIQVTGVVVSVSAQDLPTCAPCDDGK